MPLHTLCMGAAVTAKFFHKGLTSRRPQSHGFNPPSAEHQHVLFGPPGSQEATVNCETIVKWQLVTTGSANVCLGWSNTLARKSGNLRHFVHREQGILQGEEGTPMNFTGEFIHWTHLHFEPPFLNETIWSVLTVFCPLFLQRIH